MYSLYGMRKSMPEESIMRMSIALFIGRPFDDDWGLEDPTGKSDEEFKTIIKQIEKNILQLRNKLSDYNLLR